MPNKFKKAIGAVKDHTSISLAKVSNAATASSSLEVTILKATSHDNIPIRDKHIHKILTHISISKPNAAACASLIAKRIQKTRNWIVALKSLTLLLRIFQDGDPFFPIEVLHAMKRGAKILNLSNFKDESNSCPWDYSAFVRNFSLYLNERLECFLTGKLQRRFTYHNNNNNNNGYVSNIDNNANSNEPAMRDMKPAMLLDRIQYWQKLLDRAIATLPAGVAKTNRLALISLYAIVQETYDLYRDISDGLGLLLESFFHLERESCLKAFHACVKASNQFEELSRFYDTCKGLGLGRMSEYPNVMRISEELIETLQEFVNEQSSFKGRSPPRSHRKDKGTFLSPERQFENANSEPYEGTASDFGSACTSLSDLASVGGAENGYVSPSRTSVEQDYLTSDEQFSEKNTFPLQSPVPEFMIGHIDKEPRQQSYSEDDILGLLQPQEIGQIQEGDKPQWELALFEYTNSPNNISPNLLEASSSPDLDYFFQNSSTSNVAHDATNPFLQDLDDGFAIPTSNDRSRNVALESLDSFSFPSTSQPSPPPPTFCVRSSSWGTLEQSGKVDSKMVPTFHATFPDEGEIAPTFQAEFRSEKSYEASFGEDRLKETEATPTFSSYYAQNASTGSSTPTFVAEFPMDRTLDLSVCAENSDNRTTSQSFGELTLSVAPTFRSDGHGNELTATPTFSTRSEVFGSPIAIGNDDPFGPFFSETCTSEPMCNGTLNQEAVLLQQRRWLEQQSKIIARHFDLDC